MFKQESIFNNQSVLIKLVAWAVSFYTLMLFFGSPLVIFYFWQSSFSWALNSIPLREFLYFGFIPSLIFVFSLLLNNIDLEEFGKEGVNKVCLTAVLSLMPTILTFIPILLGFVVICFFSHSLISYFLFATAYFSMLGLLSLEFSRIVVLVNDENWDLLIKDLKVWLCLAFIFLFTSYFFALAIMKNDFDEDKSSLPQIESIDGLKYRLLFENNGLFYVFRHIEGKVDQRVLSHEKIKVVKLQNKTRQSPFR